MGSKVSKAHSSPFIPYDNLSIEKVMTLQAKSMMIFGHFKHLLACSNIAHDGVKHGHSIGGRTIGCNIHYNTEPIKGPNKSTNTYALLDTEGFNQPKLQIPITPQITTTTTSNTQPSTSTVPTPVASSSSSTSTSTSTSSSSSSIRPVSHRSPHNGVHILKLNPFIYSLLSSACPLIVLMTTEYSEADVNMIRIITSFIPEKCSIIVIHNSHSRMYASLGSEVKRLTSYREIPMVEDKTETYKLTSECNNHPIDHYLLCAHVNTAEMDHNNNVFRSLLTRLHSTTAIPSVGQRLLQVQEKYHRMLNSNYEFRYEINHVPFSVYFRELHEDEQCLNKFIDFSKDDPFAPQMTPTMTNIFGEMCRTIEFQPFIQQRPIGPISPTTGTCIDSSTSSSLSLSAIPTATSPTSTTTIDERFSDQLRTSFKFQEDLIQEIVGQLMTKSETYPFEAQHLINYLFNDEETVANVAKRYETVSTLLERSRNDFHAQLTKRFRVVEVVRPSDVDAYSIRESKTMDIDDPHFRVLSMKTVEGPRGLAPTHIKVVIWTPAVIVRTVGILQRGNTYIFVEINDGN